jgi:hypothetical protein
MRRFIFTFVALLLGGHMAAGAAHAGIADSPLPVLEAGKKTYHLYSIPGVIDQGGLATFFACTSTDTAPMTVGVELFGTLGGAPGNDPVASSLTILPGGTLTFGTRSAVGIGIDSLVGGGLSRGSARILSTSKKLVCTAFVADISNAPPTSMTYLTIIKKTTQKAAN